MAVFPIKPRAAFPPLIEGWQNYAANEGSQQSEVTRPTARQSAKNGQSANAIKGIETLVKHDPGG
jgi:hypothetical protein